MKIKVDIAEAYRYMGGSGNPDGPEEIELIKASDAVLEKCVPRTVERICGIRQMPDGIRVGGTGLLLTGKAVENLLRECSECAIFCATIGQETEELIRRWEVKDIAFAAALDACASSAVESLCDEEEDRIGRIIAADAVKYKDGYFFTDRFSPGYEDLPLSLQRDFCETLDTGRKIGITVNGSGLMIPRKSVTAVIGISGRKQKHRESGCENCTAFGGCVFRERGVTCYGHIL
jgi:hypothetical protein